MKKTKPQTSPGDAAAMIQTDKATDASAPIVESKPAKQTTPGNAAELLAIDKANASGARLVRFGDAFEARGLSSGRWVIRERFSNRVNVTGATLDEVYRAALGGLGLASLCDGLGVKVVTPETATDENAAANAGPVRPVSHGEVVRKGLEERRRGLTFVKSSDWERQQRSVAARGRAGNEQTGV